MANVLLTLVLEIHVGGLTLLHLFDIFLERWFLELLEILSRLWVDFYELGKFVILDEIDPPGSSVQEVYCYCLPSSPFFRF